QLARRPAEHEQAAAGIVGHEVDQLRVETGDAAADNLDGGQAVADGAQHVDQGRFLHVEVAVQHHGDLAFQPRLQYATFGDLVAVAEQHVGIEHAVGRLGGSEHRLRALGAQGDLASDRTAACLQPVVAVGGLHGIGRGDVLGVAQVAQVGAGGSALLRLAQAGGGIDDGFHFHVAIPAAALVCEALMPTDSPAATISPQVVGSTGTPSASRFAFARRSGSPATSTSSVPGAGFDAFTHFTKAAISSRQFAAPPSFAGSTMTESMLLVMVLRVQLPSWIVPPPVKAPASSSAITASP